MLNNIQGFVVPLFHFIYLYRMSTILNLSHTPYIIQKHRLIQELVNHHLIDFSNLLYITHVKSSLKTE